VSIGPSGVSFRLAGKHIPLAACTCLYRAIDPSSMTTAYLALTKEGRFAYLSRAVGGKGLHTADEWSPARAMRFLVEHGEGDLVEEFADIFRKRGPVRKNAASGGKIAATPKNRPTEPYLFPLI